jgi:hypothetical protein
VFVFLGEGVAPKWVWRFHGYKPVTFFCYFRVHYRSNRVRISGRPVVYIQEQVCKNDIKRTRTTLLIVDNFIE